MIGTALRLFIDWTPNVYNHIIFSVCALKIPGPVPRLVLSYKVDALSISSSAIEILQ